MTSITSSFAAINTEPPQGSVPAAGAKGGAGVHGGYSGHSLLLQIFISLFLGLAVYNTCELLVLIFFTFKRYKGLYFWSMIIAGAGILPYSIGFLLKFFRLPNGNQTAEYFAVTLITVGWWTMVTGQSVVLWSRLHLVLNNRKVLYRVLYMIMTNAVILHIPTTVFTYGSNANNMSNGEANNFVYGYKIIEKIQMCGFFIQETIISFLYVKETVRLGKLFDAKKGTSQGTGGLGNIHDGSILTTRRIMYQLVTINVLIIMMDCGLLAVEFANLYIIETTLKGFFYSIKLKLEFAVLGKLIKLVTTNRQTTNSKTQSSTPRRSAVPAGVHLDQRSDSSDADQAYLIFEHADATIKVDPDITQKITREHFALERVLDGAKHTSTEFNRDVRKGPRG